MFGGLECVAADLDGTLLGPDGLPGKADRAAVRALSAAGIRVVAVTGRHPHIAEWPVRLAGCHPAAICMNGAAVYDFAAGAYRAVEYMPGEEAYRACRLLDRLGAPYAAYAANAILLAGAWEAGNFYEAHFSRCGPRFRHKPVYCRDSADFGGREIADLLLPGVPSEAAEALRALAGRMEGVRLVSSSGSCVDLCGAGVSKGAALREYCRREGFSLAGTLALGDEENDLSMLEICGQPFVPEGSAISGRLSGARVTARCGRDPLANALRALFPAGYNTRPRPGVSGAGARAF